MIWIWKHRYFMTRSNTQKHYLFIQIDTFTILGFAFILPKISGQMYSTRERRKLVESKPEEVEK